MSKRKDSLNDYCDAFIAETEAEYRRVYGIMEITSKDCDILWELETREEKIAYLKKRYPSYFKDVKRT